MTRGVACVGPNTTVHDAACTHFDATVRGSRTMVIAALPTDGPARRHPIAGDVAIVIAQRAASAHVVARELAAILADTAALGHGSAAQVAAVLGTGEIAVIAGFATTGVARAIVVVAATEQQGCQ